jgi:hypothetical protein
MRALRTGMTTMLFSVLLIACASAPQPSKRDLIIGAWQAEFEGQPMTLEYGATEVTVRGFGLSFPYEWVDEDNIRLDAMGQTVISRVDFDSPDVMRQTADGQQQIMRRVP